MTLVAVILFLVVAAGAAVAVWLRRSFRRSEEAFAERVRRHGLGPFDRRLREDILRKARPMDHLSVTRMMIEILDQLDVAEPGAGQAAVVTPPDEAYRLACEELVALQKLVRTPSGDYVRAVRPPR